MQALRGQEWETESVTWAVRHCTPGSKTGSQIWLYRENVRLLFHLTSPHRVLLCRRCREGAQVRGGVLWREGGQRSQRTLKPQPCSRWASTGSPWEAAEPRPRTQAWETGSRRRREAVRATYLFCNQAKLRRPPPPPELPRLALPLHKVGPRPRSHCPEKGGLGWACETCREVPVGSTQHRGGTGTLGLGVRKCRAGLESRHMDRFLVSVWQRERIL